MEREYHKEFLLCQYICISLGNVCRIEVIPEDNDGCRIKAVGDPIFLRYFDVESQENTVFVNIKNPSGSDIHWEAYDRQGFGGENIVQIFTKCENIQSINYLDLTATALDNSRGNFEIVCSPKCQPAVDQDKS